MTARSANLPRSNEEILELLRHARIDLEGQFALGSNYTFLVRLTRGNSRMQAVYKPIQGQAPLWDFPAESLAGREVAAYMLSGALNWELVPATILRAQGPFGAGSLQAFIPHELENTFFSLDDPSRGLLKTAALFDLIINNADRKGSHVIRDAGGHFWLIDHGLCFHAQPKLRTVIWDFAGQAIHPDKIQQMKTLISRLEGDDPLIKNLSDHLTSREMESLKERLRGLLHNPVFPQPDEKIRQFPWPLV